MGERKISSAADLRASETETQTQRSVHLHTAVSVQNDVSSLLHLIFTDVVRQRVGLKDEPALGPVLPLVAFFHHVSL